LKLDHLIYTVPDLDAAIANFEKHLGVRPTFGGRHPGLGTKNAILPLQDEIYVELMAIDHEGATPSQPRPFGLDDLGASRLATWAVRSRAIESDVEHARGRGFDPGLVIAMSRDEPSGEQLRWQLSIRREPFGDGLVPFVIDWGEAPHPARDAGSGRRRARLTRFEGAHPAPQEIREALDAMGVDLPIANASSARLEARIEGPDGILDLH
jgi:hypothetical protein